MWAENLWQDRVEATNEVDNKGIVAVPPKKPLEAAKPLQKNSTFPGQPLSAEQKELAFGQQLLEYKYQKCKIKIDKMLDLYVNK